jgi:hypothetical protein
MRKSIFDPDVAPVDIPLFGKTSAESSRKKASLGNAAQKTDDRESDLPRAPALLRLSRE